MSSLIQDILQIPLKVFIEKKNPLFEECLMPDWNS